MIEAFRDSSFGMPAIQSIHLVALTVLLATLLILNLRLASVSMRDWPLASVERELRPWTLGAIAIVVLSGLLMFVANTPKYLASPVFLYKMTALGLALVCHFGVLRRFYTSEPGSPGSHRRWINVTVAGLSLTLWFSIGWAGRLIAFV